MYKVPTYCSVLRPRFKAFNRLLKVFLGKSKYCIILYIQLKIKIKIFQITVQNIIRFESSNNIIIKKHKDVGTKKNTLIETVAVRCFSRELIGPLLEYLIYYNTTNLNVLSLHSLSFSGHLYILRYAWSALEIFKGWKYFPIPIPQKKTSIRYLIHFYHYH